MGGGDSARIHPGAEAGEVLTWESLAGLQVCSLGPGKEKRVGERLAPPGRGWVGANGLRCSVFMHIC